MTTERRQGQSHPVSGTEASSGPAVPSGTTAEPDTAARRGTTPLLSLPGLPSSVDPKRALWWGGLAALAAVEVIEWPVAVVVGVGSYVAERWARDDARRAAQQRS